MEVKKEKPVVYRVYDELKNFVGRDSAIRARDLAAKFNMSERSLREVIHTIRESGELEKSIGSSASGYFICTKEDCEQAINRLYRQAFSTLKIARALEKKVGMNGQMKLKLGEYFKKEYQSLGEIE